MLNSGCIMKCVFFHTKKSTTISPLSVFWVCGFFFWLVGFVFLFVFLCLFVHVFCLFLFFNRSIANPF